MHVSGRAAGVLVALVVGGSGCDEYRTVTLRESRPVRLVPPEDPSALPVGSVAISGAYGRGRDYEIATEGEPGIELPRRWGQGRFAVGVADGAELSAEGHHGRWAIRSHVCPEEGDENYSTSMSGGRLGWKFSPRRTRNWLAVRSGAGVGRTGLGTQLGADLGLILGWANRYVSPFVSFDLQGSAPIRGYKRHVLACGDEPNGIDLFYNPSPMVFGSVTHGLRLHVPAIVGRRLSAELRVVAAGTFEWSFLGSVTGIVGLELVLGRRPQFP